MLVKTYVKEDQIWIYDPDGNFISIEGEWASEKNPLLVRFPWGDLVLTDHDVFSDLRNSYHKRQVIMEHLVVWESPRHNEKMHISVDVVRINKDAPMTPSKIEPVANISELDDIRLKLLDVVRWCLLEDSQKAKDELASDNTLQMVSFKLIPKTVSESDSPCETLTANLAVEAASLASVREAPLFYEVGKRKWYFGSKYCALYCYVMRLWRSRELFEANQESLAKKKATRKAACMYCVKAVIKAATLAGVLGAGYTASRIASEFGYQLPTIW